MKGIKPLFAVCLVFLGLSGTWADDVGDAARAATRRNTQNTVTNTRKKPVTNTGTATTTTPAGDTSRKVNITQKTNTGAPESHNVTPRGDGNIVSTSRAATATPNGGNATVTARTTSNVLPRATTTTAAQKTTTPRVRTTTRSAATPATTSTRVSASNSRSAISHAGATRTPATNVPRTTRHGASRAGISRAAAIAGEANAIAQRDYKKCRDVYYNCMDEFCANKDSQLRRCACSTRVNEFDQVKQTLAKTEEKLLDFSQRLLTVSMEKEDAAALYQETAGEAAFNQGDKSESQKILNDISKKLNSAFGDVESGKSLGAITLSLDADSAFDSVDSLFGASTITKTGTALYNAALPVCQEMAAEVCTDDELDIAMGGYQMAIELDCNTVAKSYQTQTEKAQAKIHESSALLDMSRLQAYQERNSDDALTCKKKMLDMLSDASICGENLGRCLDITGHYVDPTTGTPFLTPDLVRLSGLITRPETGQTWKSVPNNAAFVSHLNSKKKFLEPAMENCQVIADSVWDDFVEDAVAQIKLAQDKKLEDIRQSCTTLTTQCLDDAYKTLTDFDARALSIFGVSADITANGMCADIKNTCTALMNETDTSWQTGMTDITNAKTYDTIVQTCTQLGRDCIINTCKSVDGNFGMCTSVTSSVNRKAILNRTACWENVKQCVARVGEQNIEDIFNNLIGSDKVDDVVQSRSSDTTHAFNNLYKIIYDNDNDFTINNAPISLDKISWKIKNIYDICNNECSGTPNSSACYICRISERIWGNCEFDPNQDITDNDAHNKIIQPKNPNDTLLGWFANNTNSLNELNGCSNSSCRNGQKPWGDGCYPKDNITTSYEMCAPKNQFYVDDTHNNCCSGGFSLIDEKANTILGGVCCESVQTIAEKTKVCASRDTTAAHIVFQNGDQYLLCLETGATAYTENPGTNTDFPNGIEFKCDGYFVKLNIDKGEYKYTNLGNIGDKGVVNTYQFNQKTECEERDWDKPEKCPKPTRWKVTFK